MSSILASNKLRLIITGECNLSCFYCHNEGQAQKAFYISPTLVELICSALASEDVVPKEVTISGGEPLLHPCLMEIVAQAASICAKVTLVTNGVLFTKTTLASLGRAGLTKIRLGVDSLEDDKPRPSPGRVHRTLTLDEVVVTAHEAGIPVELNTVLTKFSRRHIAPIVQYALVNALNTKFFEHVEVEEFGDSGKAADMVARPHITLNDFIVAASTVLNMPRPTTVEPFGDSNVVFKTDVGVELRYCRFLCPYRLCWTTGTRVDPLGYVYNCMSNRGLDRIVGTAAHAYRKTLSVASSRPCDARLVSGGSWRDS
jgi:GTP 3',8-cyclase